MKELTLLTQVIMLTGSCNIMKDVSNVKRLFDDNSRAEQTIFTTEYISFSLKLLSGQCFTQSFIKTIRGPLSIRLEANLINILSTR